MMNRSHPPTLRAVLKAWAHLACVGSVVGRAVGRRGGRDARFFYGHALDLASRNTPSKCAKTCRVSNSANMLWVPLSPEGVRYGAAADHAALTARAFAVQRHDTAKGNIGNARGRTGVLFGVLTSIVMGDFDFAFSALAGAVAVACHS